MHFVFSLDKLLKYRRNRRDLVRQLLAQVLESQQSLAAQGEMLERARDEQLAELRRLGQAGGVDIDRSASRRYYAGQLAGERRLLQQNRNAVAEQVELCRQALAQADRDVKILEKLEEKQRAAFQHEQERRAQREREEAWLASHRMEFSK